MIQQLAVDVKTLKENQQQSGGYMNQPSRGGGNQWGTGYRNQQGRGRGQWRDRNSQPLSPDVLPAEAGSYPDVKKKDEETICWRCGQVGHIALGCYVCLDHTKRESLNSNRPASNGGQ